MPTKRLPQQSERKRSVASASSGALQHLLRDHPLNELRIIGVGSWDLTLMTRNPKKDSTAVAVTHGSASQGHALMELPCAHDPMCGDDLG